MLQHWKFDHRVTAILAVVCGMSSTFHDEAGAAQRSDGQLTISVVDAESSQPIVARMLLKNARGRAMSMRLPGTAEFGGHFYADGKVTLPLRVGQYTFELDAGPEYRTQSGHFEIERYADDSKQIQMKRFANLAEEGWYGGDLDVARRADDLPLIKLGEGLKVVTVQPSSRRPRRVDSTGPTSDSNKVSIGPLAQLVESPAGDLLLLRGRAPVDMATVAGKRSTLSVIRDARTRDALIVARTPYSWDLPVWLASGELDAIQLIHHHSLASGVLDNERDGRPRDKRLFPGATGNGRWSESVYYHVLNCGFRIPPAAGSGSGANDNPVGTNRMYVFCGDEFSDDNWWHALEAGRVVVTNGPLLRPKVEGQAPGYVFHLNEAGTLSFEIALDLATRAPVEYLQIIKNGEVAAEVRLADWVKQKGRLPTLVFDDSGWFLVRAVTNETRNYQFASSGPYYVEKAGQKHISRRSVQFFLDWIDAAVARIQGSPDLSAQARENLLAEQEVARQHFEQLLAQANAD